MMTAGRTNEDIVIAWLKTTADEIFDYREFRLAQHIDIDVGVQSPDGEVVLVEIKSDRWINEMGNLFFETQRVNHNLIDKWATLGWGWRSPAQMLIVRNPVTGAAYVFDLPLLRRGVANYIGNVGKNLKQRIVETDYMKTTFGFLIPMDVLKYEKYIVE